MRILVKFTDLRSSVVRADELQELIQSGKVLAFRRSDDEWVKIGVDPIRGTGGRYKGPERRGNVYFM
ncbi:MAG: hypothetical protein CXR31_15625 [Geobacter sp.]|nr:MAG: hypothetical protein CXR31_15625 [Geobacter sp.]